MRGGLITYALTCGDTAELHDKEVTLTTSDVTGSQTAIFEYDPQDEPVTGDPAGPWDGYSLFTIDLSGVKDDIEDLQQQVSDLEDELEDCHDCRDAVVAAIQQYIPDYDPAEGECPAPEIANVYQAGADSVNLGSKFITANGTYLPASDNLDGYNQVVVDVPTWESCIQTIAAKLGVQEPYDCQDITDAIDEKSGFDPPVGTPIEDVFKIMGIGDTVEIEGNDYYFAVYAEGWYRSFNPSTYPQIDIKENSFYTATTPPNYDYGSLGWVIYVYSKATKELVTTVQLGTFQGFDAGEYVKLISCTINYTNKTMNGVYETDDPYPHTPIQIAVSADLTRYITTTSPNPQYKVKNS